MKPMMFVCLTCFFLSSSFALIPNMPSLPSLNENVKKLTDRFDFEYRQIESDVLAFWKPDHLKEMIDNVDVDKLEGIQAILWQPNQMKDMIDSVNLGSLATLAVLIDVLVPLIFALIVVSQPKKFNSPYGLNGYDAAMAAQYFGERPFLFAKRLFEILFLSTEFAFALLADAQEDKLNDEKQESARAVELSVLLTKLGPTFIKVGQALSIRTDLLRPAYIRALTALQDNVPSFPTIAARKIIEDEFGPDSASGSELLACITPDAQVVAAASLGQVFKVNMNDGTNVAVKVQRPNIVEQISLDMHILRTIAPVVKSAGNLNTNLTGIIDEWGKGFVDELDYEKEGLNAGLFMDTISRTPLKEVVFAPPVLQRYSGRKVLTTEWIDGVRLDKSEKSDVAALCSVAMNAYLTMMLEGSVLHCDPHPGNLKRTPDGRLCILDWGLVTTLPPDLQADFIAHIAHLTSKDYEKVPADLVKLGFVPEGKEQVVLERGVVETLASIYGQWAKGGGAAKVDVTAVVSQLKGLVDEYGNVFQLPPYFAYIARAFGVLEGIGLSVDPDYAILGECLPYISQRLLVDTNERTGDSLGTFIFGASKEGIMSRVIDVDRVALLVDGFANYEKSTSSPHQSSTTATATGTGTGTASSSWSQGAEGVDGVSSALRVKRLEERADMLINLLAVGPDRSLTPLQKLIIDETAKVLAASTRRGWLALRSASGTLPTGRSVLGTVVDPLGLFSKSKLIETTAVDEQVLEASERLAVLLARLAPREEWLADSRSGDVQKVTQAVARKLWNKREDLGVLGAHLVRTMLLQTVSRLEPGTANANASTNAKINDADGGGPPSPLSGSRVEKQRKGEEVDESERLRRAREMITAAAAKQSGAGNRAINY